MENVLKFAEAKAIVRKGIHDQITFAELRKLLLYWRKRPLQTVIFDVMAEMGLTTIPFAGMVTRPRLTRPSIPVTDEGNICISGLLAEKGFTAENCAAFAHVGPNKITLTIKKTTR